LNAVKAGGMMGRKNGGDQMKKYLVAGIVVLLAAGTSLAATFSLAGRAGLFTVPGGGASSSMYGLAANVRLTDNWSLRASIDTTSYTAGSSSVTYTPVMFDVIYSQTVAVLVHPYVGAGVSYNTTTTTGLAPVTSTGAQAEAGVKINLGGVYAGVEYCYIIPDLNHTGVSASFGNAYAVGGLMWGIGL
jgi:hypothetical protein